MMFDPSQLPPGESIFPTPTYFDENQFFGRSTDVDRTTQLLNAGSSVAISGIRRIGRSWFLHHLCSVLPQDKYVVIYDESLMPDTIVPRRAVLFLHALIYALHTHLYNHLRINAPCRLLDLTQAPDNIGHALRQDLRNLHDHFKSANRRAVILIDEAEALFDFQDEEGIVPAIVRSLTRMYSHFRVIVAGFDLQSRSDHRPALFTDFAHHQLHGIANQGSYALIVEQLSSYSISFKTTADWERIRLLTGEEPAWLRLLGQQLVEQARINNGIIGGEQITEAVEDFFGMQQVDEWIRYAWDRIGAEPIRILLTAIAYYGDSGAMTQHYILDKVKAQFYADSPPDTITRDLRRLCSLGFLIHHSETDSVTFSSALMREWIRRNRQDPAILIP